MQDGEGEADRSGTLLVLERLSAIELLAHVVGHFLVQPRLRIGELVGDRVGNTFRKERRRVELQQAFLHHPAHEVRHIRDVDSIPEASLEAVAIEQGHEKLEIRFLPVVRRRRHQQEMAREGGEQLAELVTLRVFDLAAENAGRHLVRLIADDQVPPTVGSLELLLDVLVARQFIEPRDHEVRLQEPVARPGGFEFVVRQNLERQMESPVEFVLPLFSQATGAHNQTPVEITTGDQFLHQQTGHDRLASPGIVGQQESQRLAGEHDVIDGGDLVR